jgi:hypothetical protein
MINKKLEIIDKWYVLVDHHSPPLDMLFDVCKKVNDSLRE